MTESRSEQVSVGQEKAGLSDVLEPRELIVRRLAGHVALGKPPMDDEMRALVREEGDETSLRREVHDMAQIVNPDAPLEERISSIWSNALTPAVE